jgi:hypothetical protein
VDSVSPHPEKIIIMKKVEYEKIGFFRWAGRGRCRHIPSAVGGKPPAIDNQVAK